MPSKRISIAKAGVKEGTSGAPSTQVRYCKSIATNAGAFLDVTGRTASARYMVRQQTRPSATEVIAKDWSRVGETLSAAFADAQVRRAGSKRR